MLFQLSPRSALLLPFVGPGTMTTAWLLARAARRGTWPDVLLALLILLPTLTIAQWMLGFAGWYDSHDGYSTAMFYVPWQLNLLLGPAYYFYLRSLTSQAEARTAEIAGSTLAAEEAEPAPAETQAGAAPPAPLASPALPPELLPWRAKLLALMAEELAQRLRTNPGLLCKVINAGCGQNFNDFVNTYRVQEARRKLADARFGHYSPVGVALESGFNSKSTFNRVFKKLLDQAPSEVMRPKSYQIISWGGPKHSLERRAWWGGGPLGHRFTPNPAPAMRTLFLPTVLAGTTLRTVCGGITFQTVIEAGKQFVLGGQQRGAFRVAAHNVGPVPVSVAERLADGVVPERGPPRTRPAPGGGLRSRLSGAGAQPGRAPGGAELSDYRRHILRPGHGVRRAAQVAGPPY